jgi:hypothetical protein
MENKIKVSTIFFSFDENDLLDEKIKKNNGTNYNHCGIVVGDNKILEAIPKVGVIISNLDKYKNYHFYKVNVEKEISIDNLLKIPYDNTFIDPKKTYCSKLVNEIFSLVDEHLLVFEDKIFWSEYYKKLGMEIPVAYKGTNPNSLSRSHKISRIK